MSVTSESLVSAGFPATPQDVLERVNQLVPTLRARGRETELLRRMTPETVRDLMDAGVPKLTLPADVGGYQADTRILCEVLAQIARGCPSTSFICLITLASQGMPAMVGDAAADEIYATPDVWITGPLAPTGTATPTAGGFRLTGEWRWNTGGVHSNWLAIGCMAGAEPNSEHSMALVPTSQVVQLDNWNGAGMAGTATNIVRADDVFVPSSRVLSIQALADATTPQRRYSSDPYYNRPWVMLANTLGAGTLTGMARGAMDVFKEQLAVRGPITFTGWISAAEAPVLHHQLARAQYHLEIAEMYMERLIRQFDTALERRMSVFERVQSRGWFGAVAEHSRSCVTELFQASGASQVVLDADIQRYFRDVNVVCQHAHLQPNSATELYGRLLAGQEPDTFFY
jgi:alkylation response protein AidB-like acyl-CoA dehydrogenase